MCHGDIAPRTFEWSGTTRIPQMKPLSTHVCRKWEPLLDYARLHIPTLGKEDHAILKHPQLGKFGDLCTHNTEY